MSLSHTLNLVATKDPEEVAKMSKPFKKYPDPPWEMSSPLEQIEPQHAGFIQEILGSQLVIPNATCWNSTYNALDRVDYGCLKQGDVSEQSPNVIDIAVLKQVYNILAACVVEQVNFEVMLEHEIQ